MLKSTSLFLSRVKQYNEKILELIAVNWSTWHHHDPSSCENPPLILVEKEEEGKTQAGVSEASKPHAGRVGYRFRRKFRQVYRRLRSRWHYQLALVPIIKQFDVQSAVRFLSTICP